MSNCQKFNFLPFLTLNSVTTRVRDLNGTNQISLVTHDAKGEMREIEMRYRQVSRECWPILMLRVRQVQNYIKIAETNLECLHVSLSHSA